MIQIAANQHQQGAAVLLVLQQGGGDQRKDHLYKFFATKFPVKSILADVWVTLQDTEHTCADVSKGALHHLSALLLFACRKAQRVQGEKGRILLAALTDAVKQPFDAVGKAGKLAGLPGQMEDVVPHAFYNGADQIPFGGEIVVNRANRNTAGGSDGTHIHRAKTVLGDELAADRQDGVTGGDEVFMAKLLS